ncbi:AraC family transcriptional regulator [Motiliproteus sp. MSK22-1]|uniref:AraC family transcriptional regulator n=1 Tax=Motiliproteus sp. MSK22-1 TaxID=1897630 RepID=UPI00097584F3|nr:AraC family transcriptional regulator [Motiliproteus sp. MSK22-1]OMH39715.1 AraC family transcriptional regulator [Motiliproteus sp. MSK22-1]
MNKDILQLTLRSYLQNTQVHEHEFHQLVLPVKGQLELDVGCISGVVDKQHGAVIAAGREHSFEGRQENCFIVADIPSGLAPRLEALPAFLELDGIVVQYIRFLHEELVLRKDAVNPLLQRQMLLLLVQLLDERFGSRKTVDRRVEMARAYLEQNFEKTVTMGSLANTANLSERHLRELFQSSYGMSPSQYLMELRMQAAWNLLKTTEHSVQSISEKVGYQNISAFSDRFRKHFGSSPQQFRRQGK